MRPLNQHLSKTANNTFKCVHKSENSIYLNVDVHLHVRMHADVLHNIHTNIHLHIIYRHIQVNAQTIPYLLVISNCVAIWSAPLHVHCHRFSATLNLCACEVANMLVNLDLKDVYVSKRSFDDVDA